MDGKNSPTPATASAGASKATYQEIADVLGDRIRTGELKAGARLPTQAALAEEFGVERGTVREALRQLQSKGLLTNVSRGSPPQVAPRAAAETDVRTVRSILGPYLVEAFQQPQVRIDVACLTAETLMMALGEPLRKVHESERRPELVRLRILLPEIDQNLDYPSPVAGWGSDEKLDEAVRRRTHVLRSAQSTVLRQSIHELRRIGTDARIEFRYTMGTPSRKVYLLNRRQMLMGHYIAGPFEREVEGYEGANPVELYDVEGFDTPMFVFDGAKGAIESAFVEAEQLMFDGAWDRLTPG
ncbi:MULTISPECIES: GntR family transcriptional regulator [unclassified Streptomyces]|uniref:GntR family transcriptional regulator n=1 Tax=unclassified Streptomyces TaxID=2593676 RepID=UPI00278C867F|nr:MULTISPECIES: GntR family transcriptional regulator [unclassified Streptomyces]